MKGKRLSKKKKILLNAHQSVVTLSNNNNNNNNSGSSMMMMNNASDKSVDDEIGKYSGSGSDEGNEQWIDEEEFEKEIKQSHSLDEAVHDIEFIESTCSMITPQSSSSISAQFNNMMMINGQRNKVLTPKSSNKHYYNHKRSYKRSTSSPSFFMNKGGGVGAGNALFETDTFEIVLVNNHDESECSSCCKEKDSLIENRDQKAMEICKNKSNAPLDVVLERLEYKLKKIEKLEKKSEQEEEIKQRYINVKKKFLRMLELGMITSQRDSENSPPDDSIDILHKAKHNKKAILYLQSPEKFSHFLSRKALKYYYKLCQIARYGTPKSEFAATRILDNLFLGDIDDAFNEPVLKQLGITHIVTCVKSLEPIYPEKGFEYLNLHLYDEEDQNITDIFQLSYEFIEKAISAGSSVLVHCMKGKSRSASVLISYLMRKNEWSYETTLEFVKSKRKFVQPNSGFVSQLKQLERSLFNNSSEDGEFLMSTNSGTLALCF